MLADSEDGFAPKGDGALPLAPEENSELPILAVLKGSDFVAVLSAGFGAAGVVSFFGTDALLESVSNGFFGATADMGG